MSFRKKLAAATGIGEALLPSSYQVIGHVLLLKFMRIKNTAEKKKVAAAIMDMLPYVKTVCEISRVEGESRIPKVRKLAGGGTVTVHREHGLQYKLDAAKIMFSKGNLFERQRLLSAVKSEETIVDMFAGIGYFTLGLAKKCRKVIAIEKNPVAFRYLKENIRLNKLSNIEPILGDNRETSMKSIADRVVMGYFQTEKFLPFAARLLKKKGVIHFHNAYSKKELWKKPLEDVEKSLRGLRCKIMEKKIVKSTAPNAYHVVLDIAVKKA